MLPAAAGEESASRSPHPGPDIPRHLAERVLTSREALEGERKRVTVLFADLKGSMELLADRDPEEARQLLDPLLDRMMEAVHRYEGTVNQVLGDGIMALFGAPVAHEDHAVRACYAALRMQQSATAYADEIQRTHGVPVQIRVGLNSGEVVVRSIGSDLHMDYTAVGQTTHLAARMEQMAKPGSALLTADTLRLAEGHVDVRPIGPVPIRGLTDPVEVFELTGAAPTRTRLEVGAARGLTRFVGRDAEMSQLHEALTQAATGQGQIVALVGEAGVGKSRLVWELVRSHRTRQWLVLQVGAVSYGSVTSFLPVVDLLKAYFAIEGRDDARRIREKVAGRVLTLDEGLRPHLPALLALVGASVEDGAWQGLDPGERRRQALDAVRGLLLRESEVQPVLVAFEDLHWIDPDTQVVLDGLLDSLPAARVLLIVNYRPEYQHAWGSRSQYRQLRLDTLTPESAGTLLGDLLADDPALVPLKTLLVDRTQGNPFFLEECVRSLVEGGVLVGQRSTYRLARPFQTVELPPTVQAVLAARIDRLSHEDKRLLQCASVIGQDVPLALLRAIADLPEDALRDGLARLVAGEFFHDTKLFPDAEYTFKHALTLDVAYGSLLHERRRVLHARIVEVIERLYADRLAEQADRLAHHAFRGGVWGKAVTYLRQTGAQQSQASLDAVRGGQESPGYFWWTGSHDRAVTAAQRDLATAASFGSFGLRVVGSYRLAQAWHALGDHPRAIDLLRRLVTALAGDLAGEAFGMAGLPAVLARAWLGWCLAEQGDLTEALAEAESGLRLAESKGHPYSLVVASSGLGIAHLLNREPERAIAVLERGHALSRMAGIPLLHPLVAAPLGAAYARAGRAGQAVPLITQALERATATRWLAHQSLRLSWLAEAHLLDGQAERAVQVARQAIEMARTHAERGNQGYAHCVLGESAARAARQVGEDPGAAFRAGLALAEELGMRPLVERCRRGLADLDAPAPTSAN
jgi:class 3 adenylate cyclase/tetratricopeptide (TPR) repeat protein